MDPWEQKPQDSTQAAYPPPLDYPQANYAQNPYPPTGYPAPGYAAPGFAGPGYGPYTPRKTNGMAVAALVTSLVVAPLGIILGHISLAQIRRSGEEGRGLAIAGLIIGYVTTALFILAFVIFVIAFGAFWAAVENSDYSSYDDYDYSMPTETPIGVPDSSSQAIFRAGVGDCIHRANGVDNFDGTQQVTVDTAACGTSYATDRVVTRTDNSADCAGRDWVRTESYSPQVVLCLVDD